MKRQFLAALGALVALASPLSAIAEESIRSIGQTSTSAGARMYDYAIRPTVTASQFAPCEPDSNVDTCWSRGVAAARGGDQRAALEQFDQSCDAGFNELGCYEAGKLYLQNRQLRDYDRARSRLERVCDSDDIGTGPYACKYLGWMALTGTGMPRNLDVAWDRLSQACFLHNDSITIDGEGCHFLAETIRAAQKAPTRHFAVTDLLAYVALAQGCTDDAETVCEEARALYRAAAARNASWIAACDEIGSLRGLFDSCAQMTASPSDYEAQMALRRNLVSFFREETSPR